MEVAETGKLALTITRLFQAGYGRCPLGVVDHKGFNSSAIVADAAKDKVNRFDHEKRKSWL